MIDLFRKFWKKKELLTVTQVARRRTIISFLCFALLATAATEGWLWLKRQPLDHGILGGIQEPVREILDANEQVFRKSFRPDHLAKTYPVAEAAKKVRVNGVIGMEGDFDTAAWKLNLIKDNGDTLLITLEDIKKLPKTEIVFDFKCIEGWSQVTHWGGVKFSDFIKAYNLSKEASLGYTGLKTPDGDYYVGIDMPSMMHPQTLVCYEMNGKPLPMNQGYPLRLIIPVKYGIKSLKRIGYMQFSNERPPDYWFERGYDYYSGL